MFKRALVAYDGSDGARDALRMGIDLAKGVRIDLCSISVEEHLPRYAASISEVEGAKERIDEHFHRLTKEARDQAALEGVTLETVVRRGHEVETILDVAREGRFDLLILASHGRRRVSEILVGSTALSAARLAPCSTLLVRPRRGAAEGLGQIRRIVVGIDGSPLGRLAFRTALDLAILYGAKVVGTTVHEVSPLARSTASGSAYVRQLASATEAHAQAAGIDFERVVRSGHAAQVLRDQARDVNADLIVLGATGLEHPWSPTIGGTAIRVASEASCSVLLVRPPQAVLHVGDVMMRGVSAVAPDTPLVEVVELLLRRNVKALPVVDTRRRVVGIITGGDLLARGDLVLRLSMKQELDAPTLRQRLQALTHSRKVARDVMTRPVQAVGADLDLAGAIRLMAIHRMKRLPVVDDAQALVGIVTRADVLRALAAAPESLAPAERELPPAARTVGEAVVTDAPAVTVEAPAEEVLSKILASPLRRVVVLGPNGAPLGIISDRDLLARSSAGTRPWVLRLLRGEPPSTAPEAPLTAAAFMTTSPVTVRTEDSLVHAIRLMMQHQVKRLVVVDGAGRFRGLVDRREVLRLLAGQPAS